MLTDAIRNRDHATFQMLILDMTVEQIFAEALADGVSRRAVVRMLEVSLPSEN